LFPSDSSTWTAASPACAIDPRVRPQSCAPDQHPIALWESGWLAQRWNEVIAADVTRARRAKVIDQHAAVFILQGALDRLARGTIAP
jgi:hypothetical protein